MDLALHLGMTVEELERKLTVVELGLWMKYAGTRMLPWRRMELYLAQVALKIVTVMGGNTEATLSDYIFDPVEESGGADEEEEAVQFFGFAPRNVKEDNNG